MKLRAETRENGVNGFRSGGFCPDRPSADTRRERRSAPGGRFYLHRTSVTSTMGVPEEPEAVPRSWRRVVRRSKT